MPKFVNKIKHKNQQYAIHDKRIEEAKPEDAGKKLKVMEDGTIKAGD